VFIVTHADQATEDELGKIEATIRKHHAKPTILRGVHAQTGLRTPEGKLPVEELRGRRFFPFAGIANPGSFERQLRAYGEPAGHRWFDDHHDYQAGEIRELRDQAKSAGAESLVTTEKDWVKIAEMCSDEEGLPPVWRVEMELGFLGEDADRFVSKLKAVVG
jgi:tetraacyldisaccharide 4'-kinase